MNAETLCSVIAQICDWAEENEVDPADLMMWIQAYSDGQALVDSQAQFIEEETLPFLKNLIETCC